MYDMILYVDNISYNQIFPESKSNEKHLNIWALLISISLAKHWADHDYYGYALIYKQTDIYIYLKISGFDLHGWVWPPRHRIQSLHCETTHTTWNRDASHQCMSCILLLLLYISFCSPVYTEDEDEEDDGQEDEDAVRSAPVHSVITVLQFSWKTQNINTDGYCFIIS